jgi:hypothetical protein
MVSRRPLNFTKANEHHPMRLGIFILFGLTAVVGLPLAAQAQNIDSWTPKTLKTHFGAASAQYDGATIKTVTFSAGPNGNFHGDQCFELILEVLRGSEADYHSNIDFGDGIWVDHQTGCTITRDVTPGKSW